MTNWIRITPCSSIPPREGRVVRLGDVSVAIFNTGNGYYAIEDRCPHGGGPLSDGIVGGVTVTCPLHNWRICLASGRVTRPCPSDAPAVRTYPAKVEDGIIMLAVDEAQAEAA